MARIIHWGEYPPKTGNEPHLYLQDDGTWGRCKFMVPFFESPRLIVVGRNHLLIDRHIIPYNCITKGVLQGLHKSTMAWHEASGGEEEAAWVDGFLEAFTERLESWRTEADISSDSED